MTFPARSAVDGNVARFIAFRVFFNARFYYPVIAVLFLDFGLTMEQYALLNVVWAVSIVLLEVPSGALADRIGRRRMVVLAAAIMVVEMCVLCFAPMGPSPFLFGLLVVNRFLSGAAEASASGADEALAYDSLADEQRESEWPLVLSRLMRIQSVAFVVAMIVGAAVYDPSLIGSVGKVLGQNWTLPQSVTIRIPLFLTLGMSIGALISSLGMREPAKHQSDTTSTWGATWEAGHWILHTRQALLVILVAVCCDSVIRLLLTVGSEYYRLIGLPEFSFGILGAAFSALAFVVAPMGRRMVGEFSARTNFLVVAAIVLISLIGVSFAIPIAGFVFILAMGVAMVLLNFFLSHYLNASVGSEMRATVLSFKGLAMNVAFGTVSFAFAAFLRLLRNEGSDRPFAVALHWLPWYFVITLVALAVFSRIWKRT